MSTAMMRAQQGQLNRASLRPFRRIDQQPIDLQPSMAKDEH
jgi:hypothetical protein